MSNYTSGKIPDRGPQLIAICISWVTQHIHISYTLSRENRVVIIEIHGCYSLLKIAFVPICTCKNNRRIWRHNASIAPSRDVTDQLRWRHNAMLEKTVLSDNGKMSDRWLFVSWMVCPRHKIAWKKEDTTFVTVNDDFLVTREVICQWFSLVTFCHSWKSLVSHPTRDQKLLFTVAHALFFTSLLLN